MKHLRLHGCLAHFIGRRTFTIDVSTPAEAVCFLLSNFPGVEAFIAARHFQLCINRRPLDPDTELHLPVGTGEEISVIPVIGGAGGSPVGRIMAGVGLIAASLLIGPGAALFGVAIKPLVFGVGASLVLGGVSQLLSPVPKLDQGLDNNAAAGDVYTFSQIVNVTRQGVPVPILYGEPVCGSVVISAGLSVDTINQYWVL